MIVLQQNGSLLLGILRNGRIGRGIHRGDGVRIVEQAHFVHGSQDAMNHIVEAGLRHLTAVDDLREGRKEGAVRLFLIEPRQRRGCRAVRCPPVRQDETLEAPIAFQNVIEQVRVLAGIHAVHQIVGAHDRLHVGVLETNLKGQQIALASRAVIDLDVHGGAGGFLIVQCEVLDARDHVLVLDGPKMRSRDLPRQHRILALGLERAAVARLASDQVDVAAEIDIDAVGAQLGSDDAAILVRLVDIPTRGTGDGRGKCGGRSHTVANPHAAVGQIEVRDAEPRDSRNPAHGAARNRAGSAMHQLDLLILGHLCQQFIGALIGVIMTRFGGLPQQCRR